MDDRAMSVEDVERWLECYGKAWIERDPARAAALFTPDARYYETPFDAPFVGSDAIREYWGDVPRSQESISFRSRVLGVLEKTAFAAWEAQFTRAPSGERVELDGIFVLEFDESGSCNSLREWWHRRETPPQA